MLATAERYSYHPCRMYSVSLTPQSCVTSLVCSVEMPDERNWNRGTSSSSFKKSLGGSVDGEPFSSSNTEADSAEPCQQLEPPKNPWYCSDHINGGSPQGGVDVEAVSAGKSTHNALITASSFDYSSRDFGGTRPFEAGNHGFARQLAGSRSTGNIDVERGPPPRYDTRRGFTPLTFSSAGAPQLATGCNSSDSDTNVSATGGAEDYPGECGQVRRHFALSRSTERLHTGKHRVPSHYEAWGVDCLVSIPRVTGLVPLQVCCR